MLEAARDINRNVKNGTRGKGFHRLLSVMEELWPEDEPAAGLFQHRVWQHITGFPPDLEYGGRKRDGLDASWRTA